MELPDVLELARSRREYEEWLGKYSDWFRMEAEGPYPIVRDIPDEREMLAMSHLSAPRRRAWLAARLEAFIRYRDGAVEHVPMPSPREPIVDDVEHARRIQLARWRFGLRDEVADVTLEALRWYHPVVLTHLLSFGEEDLSRFGAGDGIDARQQRTAAEQACARRDKLAVALAVLQEEAAPADEVAALARALARHASAAEEAVAEWQSRGFGPIPVRWRNEERAKCLRALAEHLGWRSHRLSQLVAAAARDWSRPLCPDFAARRDIARIIRDAISSAA